MCYKGRVGCMVHLEGGERGGPCGTDTEEAVLQEHHKDLCR